MGFLQQATTLVNGVSRAVGYVSAALLVAMGGLTIADVLMRYLFNHPIRGTLELLDVLMALFVFAGLASNTASGGDVLADFLTDKWPPFVRRALDCFSAALGAAMYGLIAWGMFQQARKAAAIGDMTPALLLPVAPFQFAVAFGALLLASVYVTRSLAIAATDTRNKSP